MLWPSSTSIDPSITSTNIEKTRDAGESTWYAARRLRDDVERLAELLETQEAGIKRLRELGAKLETERERLGAFVTNRPGFSDA